MYLYGSALIFEPPLINELPSAALSGDQRQMGEMRLRTIEINFTLLFFVEIICFLIITFIPMWGAIVLCKTLLFSIHKMDDLPKALVGPRPSLIRQKPSEIFKTKNANGSDSWFVWMALGYEETICLGSDLDDSQIKCSSTQMIEADRK
ncbi:hypothetical protein BJ742DRAFT_743189 [Cladochytrium replicatum]|nr:hypothetical protein BJ742DRAFT_743189 [Cladochytrium replicatum]